MPPHSVDSSRTALALGVISCAEPAGSRDVSSHVPGFDANWRRVSSLVSDALDANPLPAEEQAISHALRLDLFEHIMEVTSDTRRAAYVADDFEFIIGAAQLGIEDPWIQSLWSTYFLGRCPYLSEE